MAVHDVLEVMNGQVDSMIGDPVLRKVVCANAFVSVS